MKAAELLVIGYGHRRRGDDAAGPLALDRLGAIRVGGLTLEEFEADGTALIERWDGLDRVVVVDAIQSGRPAGSVFVLSADELVDGDGLRCASTHGIGLLEAVRLGRALGRLPQQLWVVGVEAASFELGSEASEAVRRGAEEAARLVAERWGGSACTS